MHNFLRFCFVHEALMFTGWSTWVPPISLSLHAPRTLALCTHRGQRAAQPDTRRCDAQGQFAPLPNGATSRGAKCAAALQSSWSKSSASRFAISGHAFGSSGSAEPWGKKNKKHMLKVRVVVATCSKLSFPSSLFRLPCRHLPPVMHLIVPGEE